MLLRLAFVPLQILCLVGVTIFGLVATTILVRMLLNSGGQQFVATMLLSAFVLVLLYRPQVAARSVVAGAALVLVAPLLWLLGEAIRDGFLDAWLLDVENIGASTHGERALYLWLFQLVLWAIPFATGLALLWSSRQPRNSAPSQS